MKKTNDEKTEFEDISGDSIPDGVGGALSRFFRFTLKPFFLRNRRRNLKRFIVAGVLVLVAGIIAGISYVQRVLSLIDYDAGIDFDPDAVIDDVIEEDPDYSSMYDVTDAGTLNELLRSWALNGGEKLSSKNVINVLLVGCDNESGAVTSKADSTSRSDSMMLVSVNKKTKKITINSFLRDSYTYMDINGSERFDKTNHSYVWGGPAALIEVLENNYKIEIDHYVSINYASFVKVIDELGGVTVAVTEEEAKYMNDTTHFNDFKSGKAVTLDGQHALIFCRIRYIDNEVERTRRQRDVVSALIKSTKSVSVSQINSLLETFLPYVSTNYSKADIISLGTQAIAGKWMNYEIEHHVEPAEEFRRDCYTKTWSSSFRNPLFVWIVDYTLAARELQNSLYGTTNIVVDEETHKSVFGSLSAKPSASSGSYSGNSGNYSYNYNYTPATQPVQESTRRGIFDVEITVPPREDREEITLPRLRKKKRNTTEATTGLPDYSGYDDAGGNDNLSPAYSWD